MLSKKLLSKNTNKKYIVVIFSFWDLRPMYNSTRNVSFKNLPKSFFSKITDKRMNWIWCGDKDRDKKRVCLNWAWFCCGSSIIIIIIWLSQNFQCLKQKRTSSFWSKSPFSLYCLLAVFKLQWNDGAELQRQKYEGIKCLIINGKKTFKLKITINGKNILGREPAGLGDGPSGPIGLGLES